MNPVRNSWYVYVLKSVIDNLWYTGCSDDLNKRLKEHNAGKVFATCKRKPLILIYYEVSFDKKDAYQREKYLKSGMGKKYLKNRMKNYIFKQKHGEV